MEMFFGIILLLSVLVLVLFAIKGLNLMVGFFLITTLWLVIGLVGHAIIGFDHANASGIFEGHGGMEAILRAIQHTYQTGPQNFSRDILANIFFGAFFGRVLIETNIASTVIKKTVELGGDKPRFTMGLLSLVTGILFINMTGIGPVMAIAVIVIPILLTIGIPASVALLTFLGGITAGIMANPINFAQYRGIILTAVTSAFGENDGFVQTVRDFSYGDFIPFGFIAFAVILVAVNIAANIALSFKKTSYAWAIDTEVQGTDKKDAPWYSWLAIFIPVILITLFNVLPGGPTNGGFTGFSVIFSFILASLWAMVTTGYLKGGFSKVAARFSKYFADGAMDVAPMVGFLLTLAMFNSVAAINTPFLGSVIGGIIPNSVTALAMMFGFGAILAFFRGPINIVGSGAAFAVLLFVGLGPETAGAIGILFIYGLFAITTVVPQHLDVTQSWVAWSLGYVNVTPKQYMKMAIPTGYIISIILCFLALLMFNAGIILV